MKRLLFVLLTLAATASWGREVPPVTQTALDAYENGLAYDVKRSPKGAGITLNDLALIENDGPGSGASELGTYLEYIHKGVLAKKNLKLDDATAKEARVVLFMEPLDEDRPNQAPYYVVVNGYRVEGNPIASHERLWHWVRVPVNILKKGDNEIVVGSEAEEGKGYGLFIAREEEFEKGGGTYTWRGNTASVSSGWKTPWNSPDTEEFREFVVGETSTKSTDGGQTWQKWALGHTDDVTGEYTIRLNLTRYAPSGELISDPIDLWDVDGSVIKPRRTVDRLAVACEGETPAGTNIAWTYRLAATPDPLGKERGEFKRLGEGALVETDLDPSGGRYLQWKAVLSTDDSLATPRVKSFSYRRAVTDATPAELGTIHALEVDNAEILYSGYWKQFETHDHPKLAALRERLGLDELLADTKGDFERINRLRHHVSTLWYHGSPLPGYPEWDAMEILDRRDRVGKGGMCIQFSIVFMQALHSLGYTARHVNLFSHETIETYVDDLGKWVHIDPESVFDSYEYSEETGEPINTLEQHKYFLRERGFDKNRPIDWMTPEPWGTWNAGEKIDRQPLRFSTFTGWINNEKTPPPQHKLAGFMRVIPRNNFLSEPCPRPLNQGTYHWPWNGYLNWYDEATPRKLQYALHTDREADFYPTMDRVRFDALRGAKKGTLDMSFTTFTPNFDTYEIRIDDDEWVPSSSAFAWKLRPSGVSTLEVRSKNKLGHTGKPSRLKVLWHYLEPFREKDPSRK